VDSVAWLTAVLKGHAPVPVDFDPAEDLIAVTAMTGREYEATRQAMQEFHLPLLADHGVRYVQIARAGWSQGDGVDVLSDTGRGDPYQMVMRGAVGLDEWMFRAGTIPQTSKRDCSYWAKGWPLDTWLAAELGDTPRRHVVGFALEEELTRANKDEGYSRQVPGKTPWYPLIEWRGDRATCLAYLRDQYGIEWPRSCCQFCCYQFGDRPALVRRWQREPDAARLSVAMEGNALALNVNAKLFKDYTADAVAREAGLGHVADAAAADLAARPFALYDVRRIYRRLGDKRSSNGKGWVLGPDPYTRATKGTAVWRSTRTLATGTRDEMILALKAEAKLRGGRLDITDRYARLVLAEAAAPWPATQHGLAVAVAGADKQQDAFDSLWRFVQAYQATAPRQLDLLTD
jgi:hypothetical protein